MKEECRKFEETIQLYLDGLLSEEEEVILKRHIEGCVSCKVEVESYSVLFSGLDNMPIEEPPANFNAEVLSRIPFPEKVQFPAKRNWFGVASGVAMAVSLMVLSSLGFYSIVAGSGRISSALSRGFLKAVGAMEWMSPNSLQSIIDLVRLVNDLPVLSSIAHVGRILLGVTSTTITDPFFALMLSVTAMIGIVSTLMIKRLMRPNWNRVSVNGAGTNRVMHF